MVPQFRVFELKGYPVGDNPKKPKKDHVYLNKKDDRYYLYRGKWTEGETRCGYYNKDGKGFFYDPKKDKKAEHKEIIQKVLDSKKELEEIYNKEEEVLTDEERANVFTVEIYTKDTILVRLVKEWLEKLQLPEKILKKRFENDSEWNNFKRSLRIRNDMSIHAFGRWMDILRLNWSFDISPKEDNK